MKRPHPVASIRTCGLLAALVSVLTVLNSAPAQTTSTWNGTTGNWTDVARWSTPNFPNNGNGGVNYNAVVNAGAVTLNQNITVDGYTMGGGSLVAPGAGGPFTLTANNSLNWTGGTVGSGQTLRSNGTGTIDFPTLGGTLINAGSVNINAISGVGAALFNNLAGATFTHTGALVGTGTFNNFGTYNTFNSSRSFEWAFNNQTGGVVNVANSTIQLFGSGTHDGRFNLTNAALQFQGSTPQIFNASSVIAGPNNGIIRAFGPNITINGTYIPAGQTWVTAGSMTFNSAFANTGQFRIDAGAVNFNLPTTLTHLLVIGGAVGGSGALTFNGTTNVLFEGGTLAGTSPTSIQNVGTLFAQGPSFKTLAQNLNNANGGVITWSDGPLRMATGITLTNAVGANFNVTRNIDLAGSTTPSAGTFDNLGTVTRSTSTGTATIFSTFHNRVGATVQVQTGMLNIANPGTLAGTFNIAAGATLGFAGTVTLPGSATFTGTGTLAVTGGTATLTGTLTYPNFALTGGTLAGTGMLAVSNLSLGNGGNGALGRDLTLSATASNQFTGGTLTVNSGFTLTVPNGVNLQAVAGTIAGPGALNNQGTLTKTGTGTLVIGAAFTNAAGSQVLVQGGNVQLSNPTPLGGTFNLSTGTALILGAGANLTATSLVTGAGQVQVSGSNATIAGSGNHTYTGGTLVNNGGNVLATGTGAAFGAGNVTVASGGILRLNAAGNLAAGTKAIVNSGGTLGLESSFDPAAILDATSAGVVGIDVAGFSTPLNLSTLGNGQMFLGAVGAGDYTAATLAPGAGGSYRLGGGGGTLTLSGTNVLTGANAVVVGAAGLTGTVLIAGANNYTGNTTLAAGTLAVGNNAALGTAGTLVLNGGSIRANGGPVSLANLVTLGGNVTVTGSDNLTFTGNVTVTGNRTVSVTGPGVAAFSGNIAGDVLGRALVKDGVGTLTLSGVNTYTGGTTINAGTLRTTSNNQALGLGNVTVNSGASLRQGAFSNLGGGASVLVNSGAVLGLEGNFAPSLDPASTGMVAINLTTFSVPLNQAAMGNGQMFIGSQGTGQYNAATLGAGTGSTYRLAAAGGTLTVPAANVLTGFNSLLVGSTQPNGAGTLVLGAAQDFQGNTTVNAGSTLVLQSTLTGPGTVFVLPGGTLAGPGAVSGFTNVGGGASPGGSPGILTFNNGVSFAAGGSYIWELSAHTTSGPGTIWDQINVTGGNLTVNAASVLDIRFIGTATSPTLGDAFWSSPHAWTILTLTGTATSSGGLAFQIDNTSWVPIGTFATLPATVGSGIELRWVPVPEPVHVLLIALGAGAGWFVRRRTFLRRGQDRHHPPVSTRPAS